MTTALKKKLFLDVPILPIKFLHFAEPIDMARCIVQG